VKEIFTSIGLIRGAIAKMPEGPIGDKPKKNPEGDYFAQSSAGQRPGGICRSLRNARPSRGESLTRPVQVHFLRDMHEKCPSGAICVRKEEKTWSIDRLRCIVCNCCVEACPVHCLAMETEYTPCVTEHHAVDVVKITYVKPERPKRPETGGQEGKEGS